MLYRLHKGLAQEMSPIPRVTVRVKSLRQYSFLLQLLKLLKTANNNNKTSIKMFCCCCQLFSHISHNKSDFCRHCLVCFQLKLFPQKQHLLVCFQWQLAPGTTPNYYPVLHWKISFQQCSHVFTGVLYLNLFPSKLDIFGNRKDTRGNN